MAKNDWKRPWTIFCCILETWKPSQLTFLQMLSTIAAAGGQWSQWSTPQQAAVTTTAGEDKWWANDGQCQLVKLGQKEHSGPGNWHKYFNIVTLGPSASKVFSKPKCLGHCWPFVPIIPWEIFENETEHINTEFCASKPFNMKLYSIIIDPSTVVF